MSALGSKLRRSADHLFFWCPGCEEAHSISIADGRGGWTVELSDPEYPTFSPSVLVRSGHHAKDEAPGNCWCDFEDRDGRAPGFKCFRCHSFVRAGRIEFLSDCSHALAGQTVDLPPFPATDIIP